MAFSFHIIISSLFSLQPRTQSPESRRQRHPQDNADDEVEDKQGECGCASLPHPHCPGCDTKAMTTFTTSVAPIRLVLFDAFNTLLVPRSAPHLQYAAVAREYGFNVCDNDVKSAFKQAFRTTSIQHPNYGLESYITSPDQWWKLVIQRTFSPHLHSCVSSQSYSDRIDSLSHSLVTRFGTSEAYHLFHDVIPTLRTLSQTHTGDGRPLQLALATNSDSRILSVLKSFGLDQFLQLDVASGQTKTSGPTLSYFERCSKPDSRFFHAAIHRASFSATAETLNASNVLYVGDQLHEDFWGATSAGLQAAWLQRPTNFENNQPYQHIGNHRNTEHDQAYVRDRTIPSLECLVDIVTRTH